MSQYNCRFCPEPVRNEMDICIRCLMEGRSNDSVFPVHECKEHDDTRPRSEPYDTQHEYHGDSIRDDI